MMAAARASTSRLSRRPPPPEDSRRRASTELSRSSQVSTGMESRSARASASARACSACGPSAPLRDSGRPMTSARAPSSSTSRATASTASGPPSSVVRGMATRRPRSAAATPIRRSPGSIARMRPLVGTALSSCCDILLTGEELSRDIGHLLQRLGELRGVLAAAGGQVRPAAAAAAGQPRDLPHEGVGPQPTGGGVLAGDDQERRAAFDEGADDGGGRLASELLLESVAHEAQRLLARHLHLHRADGDAVDVMGLALARGGAGPGGEGALQPLHRLAAGGPLPQGGLGPSPGGPPG